MRPEAWQAVKRAVDEALAAPASQRSSVLDALCGDDAEVRAEAERLLRVEAEIDFLEPPGDDLVGAKIGRYRIVRLVARGGMGAVYEAEQEHPRRAVALKVIDRAGGEDLRRRFELESELLGRLDHPGIARIFEAGSFVLNGAARPFFSMELVRGRMLLDIVRERDLSVRDRVELLASLADAVHHAHQRGVIHRDLKPTNVMAVERDAGRLQVKVLDFGVARLVDLERTIATATGELVGTLRYMSPEQLGGDPAAIDLRCDVYALGVVGYELLSGRLPYDLGTGSIAEVTRSIVDREPVRLARAAPALRGDLEAVMHAALRKEPSRRYPSAAAFADDLRRFLRREPVSVRPLTALYTARTFARRNPLLVTLAAAAVAALATGVVLYAKQARRAEAARDVAQAAADRADAVTRFLTGMLGRIDPNTHGRDVDIGAIVTAAAADIEAAFADQPPTRAAVHDEVAAIFYTLGLYESAQAHYERALAAREALAPDDPLVLASVNGLGLVALRTGRMDEAIARFERVVDGRPDDDPLALVTLGSLAMAYELVGRADDAGPLLESALAAQERVRGADHPDTLATLTNLASLRRRQGDLVAAEALQRRALDGMVRVRGRTHVSTLLAMSNLASTLKRRGQYAESEALYAEVVGGLLAALGDAHPDLLTARHNRAQALLALGRAEDAVAESDAAVAGFRQVVTSQRGALPIALRTYGEALRAVGREADARAALLESVAGYEALYGPEDARTTAVRGLLENGP